jgi:hypothetical protein
MCCSNSIYGQVNTRLLQIQGIWECQLQTESTSIFKIINQDKCAEFTFSPTADKLDFTLFELTIGFQSYIEMPYNAENLTFDSLKANGLYYTEILNKKYIKDGIVVSPNFLVPTYYECDGQNMSINGGKLFEYVKLQTLPFEVLVRLHRRGKTDKRDYIKDYLNLKVLTIRNTNCKVHSTPNGQTKVQLNRDDMIIVIEDRGDWLKVQYNDNGIGWIRKGDAH